MRNDVTCCFAIKLVYRIDLRHFKVFPFIFALNRTTFKQTFANKVLQDKINRPIAQVVMVQSPARVHFLRPPRPYAQSSADLTVPAINRTQAKNIQFKVLYFYLAARTSLNITIAS